MRLRRLFLAFVALALLGRLLPDWFVLVATLAFAKGLAALGLVVLMRGGLVSFGQGLFFCAGAYAAGLAMRNVGLDDAVLLTAAGGAAALILGLVIAPLLAGYRGIFFATLTLALSMIAYGILDKFYALGGSDGLNLHGPSYFGYRPPTPAGCPLRAIRAYELHNRGRGNTLPGPLQFLSRTALGQLRQLGRLSEMSG